MDKLADEYKGKAGFYYADVEDGGINTGSAAGHKRRANGYYL